MEGWPVFCTRLGGEEVLLPNQLQLWNHAAIHVLDIRRSIVYPREERRSLRLPASAFLYTCSGQGQILIDGVVHRVDGHYVCHAGKGSSLDIVRVTEPIDYFLIYYKAVLTLPSRRRLLELYRDHSPFQAQYGFTPVHPLHLYTRLTQMHTQWALDDPLEKFHVRALFHQLVYELLQQLYRTEDTTFLQTGLAGQAVRYMEEHYAEPFSLQELAEFLQCGIRQLQRLFKSHYHMSPLEYMIQVRMEHAKGMLLNTQASIKEIAEAVGYTDVYHFSRYFKKHTGASPVQFRRDRRINASSMSHLSIGSGSILAYSFDDDENHYQYIDRGAARMHSRTKTMLAVNFMLVFMLLMGACSLGGGSTSPSASGEPVVSQSANTSPAPSPVQTKQSSYPLTIKHLKGDAALEHKPQRIAVLDTQYVDQLVALNEQPAGSVKAAGAKADFPDYLTDRLTDVKVLGTYQEPNLEAILAMSPDLIICTEFHEGIYESLSKIATTVMLERNEDWRDVLVTFGKIMDKEEEAQQALQAYKDKTAKLTADLAAKLNGQSVALIRPRDNIIRVHTPEHRTGAILYQDLGMTIPKQVAEADDTSYNISLEGLADVKADHYFLLTDDMFKGLVEEFRNTETWKSLEPVKQNRVYTVDTTMWIAYYGPLAINLIIDQVADALLGGS
jgi:iron complex transport system substrate-binding protein